MRLYELTIEAKHPNSYKPEGHVIAKVVDFMWDADRERIVVELLYSNEAIDWIPLDEILNGNYKIIKPTREITHDS